MTGGYVMLDLQDKNITIGDSTGVKIDGIFERIEGNHRKATMICNLVLDNIECSNRWVNFRFSGGAFEGTIGIDQDYMGLCISITEDDMVTVKEI